MTSRNQFNIDAERERADFWGGVIFLLFIVIGLMIAGYWDYQTARESECWEQELRYDPEADTCTPQPEAQPAKKGHRHA